MCELFFPEERRYEFTSEAWDGMSFRHYRDLKIVCLEHYRPFDKPILSGVTPETRSEASGVNVTVCSPMVSAT